MWKASEIYSCHLSPLSHWLLTCPGIDAVGKRGGVCFPTALWFIWASPQFFSSLSQACFPTKFLERSQESLEGSNIDENVCILPGPSHSAVIFLVLVLPGEGEITDSRGLSRETMGKICHGEALLLQYCILATLQQQRGILCKPVPVWKSSNVLRLHGSFAKNELTQNHLLKKSFTKSRWQGMLGSLKL